MRSKFRVGDTVATRTVIDIPCCDITIEKGARAKIKDVDPDSGDLVLGLSGNYPELYHRRNIINISATEAPHKIERVQSRMEQASAVSHLSIGGGVCAVLVILLLHFNFRPAHAVKLLPNLIRGIVLMPHPIKGPLPLVLPSMSDRAQFKIRGI